MQRIFIIAAVFLSLLPALLFPAPAQAQDPDESFPGNPYDFTPANIPDNTDPPIILGDLIRDVSFINDVGSHTATIWVILDKFAGGGILGYFVIFLLGVSVIVFVARYVYNKPIRTEGIKAGVAFDTFTRIDPTGTRLDSTKANPRRRWVRFGRELGRRKKIRF